MLPTAVAEQALEAAEEVAEDDLLVCAAYDLKRYEVLYIDDSVFGGYGNVDELFDVTDALHDVAPVDHLQRKLLDDVHPFIGGVEATATYFERTVLVRLLDGDDGLLVGLEPEAPVPELVQSLGDVLDERASEEQPAVPDCARE